MEKTRLIKSYVRHMAVLEQEIGNWEKNLPAF